MATPINIEIIAKSNLDQVIGKDAAAIQKNIGILEKLREEEARHTAAQRRFDEERTRVSDESARQDTAIQTKALAERDKNLSALDRLNQRTLDTQRQIADAERRIQEQRLNAESQFQIRMRKIAESRNENPALQQARISQVGMVQEEIDATEKRQRRIESLNAREASLQEAALSRKRTLQRTEEQETARHNQVLQALDEARVGLGDKFAAQNKAIDAQVEAENQKHYAKLRDMQQQALNEQNRIEQSAFKERQRNFREASQASFAIFGLALAIQSISRGYEEATGQKAANEILVLGKAVSTTADFMLTGSVVSQKYGAAVGGVIGVVVGMAQALGTVSEEEQKLNQSLDQLSRKEELRDTLASIAKLSKEDAQMLLDAAKASGEYAMELEKLARLRERTLGQKIFEDTLGMGSNGLQIPDWIRGANVGMAGPLGQAKLIQDYYEAQAQAADKLQQKLVEEGKQLVEHEKQWRLVRDTAEQYYNAVERGANAATQANEELARAVKQAADQMAELKARRAGEYGKAVDTYEDTTRQARSTYDDRVAALNKQRRDQAVQNAYNLTTIERDLGQKLQEIDYDAGQQLANIDHDLGERRISIAQDLANRLQEIEHTLGERRAAIAYEYAQRLAEIEHTRAEQTDSAMREYYDKEADAAWQHTQDLAQIDYQAAKNEQEYLWDLHRLEEQAALDQHKSDQQYAAARAKIARDYAYERMTIARELNQALVSLGFDTGEQMRGAKTEHEMENIQRRYQFEAAQLRQNAQDQQQDLAHRVDEQKRALDEQRKQERDAQAERLRMAREELEHRIQMQREETAHRRAELEAQYAHEREVSARELAEKLADIEWKAAYDRAQAEEKAAHDRQLADQQYAYDRKMAQQKASQDMADAERKAAFDRKQAEEKAAHDRALAKQQAENRRADLQQQIEEQKRQYAEEMAAALTAYGEELSLAKAKLEQEVKDIQTKYEIEIKAVQAVEAEQKKLHDERLQQITDEIALYKALLDALTPEAAPDQMQNNPQKDVPGFARGGDLVVNRPYLFVAGESGPERVTIRPVNEPGNSAGGGQTINFYLYDAHDSEKTWSFIRGKLQQELRR